MLSPSQVIVSNENAGNWKEYCIPLAFTHPHISDASMYSCGGEAFHAAFQWAAFHAPPWECYQPSANTEIRLGLYCISMEPSVSSAPRQRLISGGLRWSFTEGLHLSSILPIAPLNGAGPLIGCRIGAKFRLAQPCSSLERTRAAGWPLEASSECCEKWISPPHPPHITPPPPLRSCTRTHIWTHICTCT